MCFNLELAFISCLLLNIFSCLTIRECGHSCVCCNIFTILISQNKFIQLKM